MICAVNDREELPVDGFGAETEGAPSRSLLGPCYDPAMPAPPSRVALCHVENDAKIAHEIRSLVEMGRPDVTFLGIDEADLVLLLCTPASIRAETLMNAAESARDRELPALPIVAGGVTVETLPFPTTSEWGLELEDQMFAIKLLIAMNKQAR